MIEPKNGYPSGTTISYKCLECGDILPSRPWGGGTHCKCRNIFIDSDAGRLSIKNHDKAEIVKTQGGLLSKIFSGLTGHNFIF
ncbi:MAG: hypothetical protein HGB12_17825 [Bacteroidetes bacterium]|nr:hypothetical protein [Bacteroidota bacterium]